MHIREYQSSDCPALWELFYETVHEINKQDYTEDQFNAWAPETEDRNAWNPSFLSNYTLVAVENGRIVGFGDIEENGYRNRLYVHKNYQKRGIAAALCERLEEHIPGNIQTHASITAKPFFLKRGYQVVKEQQVQRQGILLTNFVMVLKREMTSASAPGKDMQKVLVIGCPGAGKSTFSRRLRDLTGLPLYYLDMIWHRSDKTNISREDFIKNLETIMENTQWIIDGNYLYTLEQRLQKCDTVFFLDYPLEVCLAGARARVGTAHEDLPWIETEFDEEFKQWILDFSNDQLPRIYQLLEKYKENRKIYIFKNREDSQHFFKEYLQNTNREKLP